MLTGFRFMELTQNLNVLVKTLQTEVEVGRPYSYLARTPDVDTENDELFGTYSGQVWAADIIVDDQEAVIHEGGGLETFRAGMVPKVKHGARVGESMIRRLNALADKVTIADGDADLITGWENNLANRLVEGIRMRKNKLSCAMMLDLVSYDRLGVKIDTGSTWGMPAELKKVSAIEWASNAAGTTANTTAKPITDIRAVLDSAAALGQTYDRVTMARSTFNLIPQTTEFQDMAKFLYRFDIPAGTLDTTNVRVMVDLFRAMTGLELEIDDSTINERGSDGRRIVSRVLPKDFVLFSNSADDGNTNVFDYSNGTVIESLVAPLGNAAINEAIGGEQRGPFAFYNVPHDLNPPALVAWAVQVGWPRKHVPEATARLRVFRADA